jgi:hypothetical protein
MAITCSRSRTLSPVREQRCLESRSSWWRYKAWMRTTLVLWWLAAALGFETYAMWYVTPAGSKVNAVRTAPTTQKAAVQIRYGRDCDG